jgi:hypothetical protein
MLFILFVNGFRPTPPRSFCLPSRILVIEFPSDFCLSHHSHNACLFPRIALSHGFALRDKLNFFLTVVLNFDKEKARCQTRTANTPVRNFWPMQSFSHQLRGGNREHVRLGPTPTQLDIQHNAAHAHMTCCSHRPH